MICIHEMKNWKLRVSVMEGQYSPEQRVDIRVNAKRADDFRNLMSI
jgi:hypothetical protein